MDSERDRMGAMVPGTWTREELDAWFLLVHNELRGVATSQRRRNPGIFEAGTTSLLHLAYERLAHQKVLSIENPEHFFSLAARMMHHILVDRARAASTQKRGGDTDTIPLDELEPWLQGRFATEADLAMMLDMEDALEGLSKHGEDLVQLVEHHIHLGMTLEEFARLREVSLSTVKRRWRLARAYLSEALDG